MLWENHGNKPPQICTEIAWLSRQNINPFKPVLGKGLTESRGPEAEGAKGLSAPQRPFCVRRVRPQRPVTAFRGSHWSPAGGGGAGRPAGACASAVRPARPGGVVARSQGSAAHAQRAGPAVVLCFPLRPQWLAARGERWRWRSHWRQPLTAGRCGQSRCGVAPFFPPSGSWGWVRAYSPFSSLRIFPSPRAAGAARAGPRPAGQSSLAVGLSLGAPPCSSLLTAARLGPGPPAGALRSPYLWTAGSPPGCGEVLWLSRPGRGSGRW